MTYETETEVVQPVQPVTPAQPVQPYVAAPAYVAQTTGRSRTTFRPSPLGTLERLVVFIFTLIELLIVAADCAAAARRA